MKRIITLVIVLLSLKGTAQCVSKAGAGSSCTFVIKADGTLWAWGRNNYGQLGIGTTVNTAVKTQVGTASNWQNIEGGQFHTVAIKSDGSLWTWGFNASGQLGLSNTTNKTIPTQVASTNVWTSVAAGYDHTVAITNDGSMYAWGLNDHGQLGIGSSSNRTTPTLIGTGWQSVSAGNNVTIAVKTDGTLWGWGEGSQVGDGTTADKYSPVQLGTATNWKGVSRGVSHTLAVKTDGTLWAWGTNGRGQLGNGTTTGSSIPAQVGTDTNWESAKSGFFFSMGRKTDGSIWSWGQNTYHQLGLGASTANVLVPTQIGTDTDWQTISVGTSSLFSKAIKNDGTFWAWGYNNYSQLGDGLTLQLQVPTFISCPASTSTTQTACDSYTWADTGTTYTTSGLYIDPATNNDLRLTINNSTTSTASATACESYTWGANGTTYTQSGTYTNVTTNASGCTDTATLLLTVDQNISTTITEAACESFTWATNGTLYTESGTYTNVSTGASGCTATATLNLTINNASAPTADSPQNITEESAGTATIADIVISPSTVAWYGSESDALAQINALDAATILTSGTTYFAVNTVQGCVSDPFPVMVSVTLGTATFDLAYFSLYPNPASGLITIRYPNGIDKVIVTNLIGQQLIAKSGTRNEATIEVANLPSGTYFAKVYSGDRSKTLKFIKE
jgi:alpha-tubulin suppressor-like RCC1 family protein